MSLKSWDVAAGALLVKEAGGRVGDFAGGTDFLRSNEVIAAAPGLFNSLREADFRRRARASRGFRDPPNPDRIEASSGDFHEEDLAVRGAFRWSHRCSLPAMASAQQLTCESRNYQQEFCPTGVTISRAWLVAPAVARTLHRRTDLGLPEQRHLGDAGMRGRLRVPGRRRTRLWSWRQGGPAHCAHHLRKPQLPAAILSDGTADHQCVGDRADVPARPASRDAPGASRTATSGSPRVAPPISASRAAAVLRWSSHRSRCYPATMVLRKHRLPAAILRHRAADRRAWLIAQRSRSACVQGRSWGFDRGRHLGNAGLRGRIRFRVIAY